MKNTRLVFSTDPKDQVRCEICQQLKDECSCQTQESTEKAYTVVFRIEKNGRGGKTVTVIEGFPKNEEFIKGLCKEMKAKCGVGGSYLLGAKSGTIEIQGDKREALKKILDMKKIKYKGV